MPNQTAQFVQALPVAGRFADALDAAAYVPVPEGWFIAVTDVVRSRTHIAEGRYKAVNMAGVAAISAAMNELGCGDLPYVFSGDGAALALAPEEARALEPVLARLVTMAREELSLDMRAALVPVRRLRADGHDVRLRPVRVSHRVVHFAFAGGGITHADRLMKQGEYRVDPAAPGQRPNLAGLSCRWLPVQAPGRHIVSLIVETGRLRDEPRFEESVARLLPLLGMEGSGGSPLPAQGPGVGWPAVGLELEARVTRGAVSLFVHRMKLRLGLVLAYVLFRTGLRLGAFDPRHYQRTTGLNTDFRKFHDGLRLTISLAPAELETVTRWLEDERLAGAIRYGMCVQDRAVLTCYVPSMTDDAHLHFLDGAGGGYAAASSALRD